VQEVDNARIWGGIHYRNSTEVGEAMGRKIGVLASAIAPQPMLAIGRFAVDDAGLSAEILRAMRSSLETTDAESWPTNEVPQAWPTWRGLGCAKCPRTECHSLRESH
jgi:hypothetical protein